MAAMKGDGVGKRSRRKEEEEKEQKRRRGKNDRGFESMAERRFDAWRGFCRLTSISRRFPWSLFLLLRSMGNETKHVRSCIRAKTQIRAPRLLDAKALLHSPGIKKTFKTTKIQKTGGLSGPTNLNTGGRLVAPSRDNPTPTNKYAVTLCHRVLTTYK